MMDIVVVRYVFILFCEARQCS